MCRDFSFSYPEIRRECARSLRHRPPDCQVKYAHLGCLPGLKREMKCQRCSPRGEFRRRGAAAEGRTGGVALSPLVDTALLTHNRDRLIRRPPAPVFFASFRRTSAPDGSSYRMTASPGNAPPPVISPATWNDRVNRLHGILSRLKTELYYKRIFGAIGPHSRIDKPLLLSNPQFVFIGAGTAIRAGARIETVLMDRSHPPALHIGSNVNIEQNVHLVCSSSISIGDNVTITGNCAIVDTIHPFEDVDDNRKIGDRIDPRPSPVFIGENSFLGFGSVILPGVRIGMNCIIGANSTVTRDIPDFCVAAGNPAAIVRRYDHQQKRWIRPKDAAQL